MAILALMPSPLAMGVALILGGATIAPALTVENSLIGRLTQRDTYETAPGRVSAARGLDFPLVAGVGFEPT
jgi:hypothetical protein